MKVFISSVITGFEAYRDAATAAATALGCEVIRAEDFPASTRSPQVACLTGVRDADLVVLVLGARYGARQASGTSATHEEYEEAKGRKPLLVFVQEKVAMEPDQEAFRRDIEAWQGGHLWKGFTTPEDLRARVTHAIHKHTLALAQGPLNEEEAVERATNLLPRADRNSAATLALSLAWAPKQQVLRPKQLDDGGLAKRLHQEARFGNSPVFDELAEAKTASRQESLVLEQRGRSLSIDEMGSVVIVQPALDDAGRGLRWIIEEDLAETLEHAIRFATWIVSTIDTTERLTHAAVACALLDAAHNGWKTREEYRREPNSGTIAMADQRIVVTLRPPVRTREEIRHDPKNLAEDLVHLLRRAHSPRRG